MNHKIEELKKAIKAAILAENTACYFDGMNGTRDDASMALQHALKMADELGEP